VEVKPEAEEGELPFRGGIDNAGLREGVESWVLLFPDPALCGCELLPVFKDGGAEGGRDGEESICYASLELSFGSQWRGL
jgi:hypothetical protein